MNKLLGCTRVCCIIQGKFVTRGESPIKLGNSWFSAKPILVGYYFKNFEGKALFSFGGI